MNIARWTTIPTLALALAACSALPLPAEVDLKGRLGEAETGRVETPIEAAETQDVDMVLPRDGGTCVDLDEEAVPVTVESAQIHWNVDVTYDGPGLSGRVQGRLYVAGPDEDLFAPRNTLGPTVTVKLDRTETRFAGTAKLKENQIRAINDRAVCWGVRVEGDDVGAAEDGTARIDYAVRDLWLKIRFSVI